MKKLSIIILHGWGLSGKKYAELQRFLEKNDYEVFAPDLPGFGTEKLSNPNMNLSDYARFLEKYIQEHKIASPVIIGHSFGGRLAVKYASLYQGKRSIRGLILTGVPIVRHKKGGVLLEYVSRTVSIMSKKVLPGALQRFLRKSIYYLLGEWDYFKSEELKQVFKNIINENMTEVYRKTNTQTLIIWGADDKLTPAEDLKTIKLLRKDVEVIVVPGEGHGIPFKNSKLFTEKALSFLSNVSQ